MKKDKQSSELNRRKFLQIGSAFAASALFLPAGASKVFGALKSEVFRVLHPCRNA